MMRNAFLLTIALLALGAICLPATKAHAETIRARYSLKYLNLNVGEIATFADVGASDYRTLLDARMTGLAAIASDFKTSMASEGLLRKGSVLPSSFKATEASSRSGSHEVRMSLDAGNVRTVDINPPYDDVADAVPVTEDHKLGVVDPTSALLLSVPGVKPTVGPAACDRTVRLFSGDARFDLIFKFVKTENIVSNAYSGPVSVCSIQFVPIAGYKPSASTIQFMAANRKIEARLAPVEKSRLVVVAALNIPFQVGTATLDLEKLDVEGALASIPTKH
jgi:hypothetical protein